MGIGGLHLSRVNLAEHEPVGIVIHRFVRRTAAPYHDVGGHLPSSHPPPNFTNPFLTIMSDSSNSCRAFYIGRMEKSAGHSRPCPHGGRRPRRWPASRAAELRFPPTLVR